MQDEWLFARILLGSTGFFFFFFWKHAINVSGLCNALDLH